MQRLYTIRTKDCEESCLLGPPNAVTSVPTPRDGQPPPHGTGGPHRDQSGFCDTFPRLCVPPTGHGFPRRPTTLGGTETRSLDEGRGHGARLRGRPSGERGARSLDEGWGMVSTGLDDPRGTLPQALECGLLPFQVAFMYLT